jgi:hypothetical protein
MLKSLQISEAGRYSKVILDEKLTQTYRLLDMHSIRTQHLARLKHEIKQVVSLRLL